MRALCLLAVVLVASPLMHDGPGARLIRVPYDYPLLNDACMAAFAGDTVGVYAGTYYAAMTRIRAGVTVRGMEADSTAARVFPQYEDTRLFTALAGDEPVLLENLEMHGGHDLGGALLNCLNPGTVIQRCYLYDVTDNEVPIPLVGASEDLTVRQCHIFSRGAWFASLVMTYESPRVVFEDCVIDLRDNVLIDIGAGTVIELKNNTFLLRMDMVISYDHEFSLMLVNNIFCDGAVCSPTWPTPDVLEWRYNDFVQHYQPSPVCGYQVGNFSADPLFCDAVHGDYRLEADSPCIGAGENGEDVGARRGICWPASVPSGEGALRGDVQITCIRPNPTSEGVTIELVGGTGEPAGAQILDPAGRVVRTVSAGRLAGRDLLGWDGCREDGRRVAAGVYYVRLTDADRSSSAQVLVIR